MASKIQARHLIFFGPTKITLSTGLLKTLPGLVTSTLRSTERLDKSEKHYWSIQVVSDMMVRWGNHPAVYAFEPVNEPWWASDFPALKGFFRRNRTVVREAN